MFIKLLDTLRRYQVPVSTRELLDLIQAVDSGVVFANQEDFYNLLRMTMVKDERLFDKFDRACKDFFQGVDTLELDQLVDQLKSIPKDWLKLELDPKNLTPEQRELLKKFGSPEELMKELQRRLSEQHKKHQGGNRMVGTGGTSAFGAFGDHPEGVRIGGPSRKKSAAKVWEQRRYKNLDEDLRLSNRQTQLALRKLRKFARVGQAEELDLEETIRKTANKGILDIQLRAERKKQVKLIMLFDIGGSMDAHIDACQQLFSAAKSEFKDLQFYYFHNCVYEQLWSDNLRRNKSAVSTYELMRKYPSDYKLVFVGDASMAPYELTHAYGSVEHMNEEPGLVWLARLQAHFKNHAWLNPEQQDYWRYTHSIELVQKAMNQRMYPLTLHGLEDMSAELAKA